FSAPYNRAAHASNVALQALQATGRADVVILALYENAAPEEVAAYARTEGLGFPIGLVAPGRRVGEASTTFQTYGVRQLPTLFLIDRDGIIRAVNPDGETLLKLTQ